MWANEAFDAQKMASRFRYGEVPNSYLISNDRMLAVTAKHPRIISWQVSTQLDRKLSALIVSVVYNSSHEGKPHRDTVPLWGLTELVEFGKALSAIGTKRTRTIPSAEDLCCRCPPFWWSIALWAFAEVISPENLNRAQDQSEAEAEAEAEEEIEADHIDSDSEDSDEDPYEDPCEDPESKAISKAPWPPVCPKGRAVSIPGDISRLIQVLLEGCFNGKSEKVIRRQLAALLRVKPGKSVKSYHVLRNDMPEQLVKEMEEADKKRKEDQRARLLENKRRYMEEKAKLKADLLKTDGKETDEDVPPLQDFTNPEDADRNLFSDEDPLPLQDSFEQDAMPKANHTLLPLQDSLEDVIPEPKVRKGKKEEAEKMDDSSIGEGREDMKKLKKKEKKEKKDNAEEIQEKKAVGKGREEMEKNQEAETANETQSQASTKQGAIPRQKKRKQDMEETQQIVEIETSTKREKKERREKKKEAEQMDDSSIGEGREDMKKLKKKEKKEKKDNAEEIQEKKAVGKGREEMEKNQEAETANETQSQASTEQGAIPRQKKRKQDMEETQQNAVGNGMETTAEKLKKLFSKRKQDMEETQQNAVGNGMETTAEKLKYLINIEI